MKTNLSVLLLLLASLIPLFSQVSENNRGFTELRSAYNISFISDDPFTTFAGIGIGTTYSLNNKLSIDLSFIVKPTKREIKDSDFIGDWIISNIHSRYESSALFIDLPIHLNYNLISLKSLLISVSSGPRFFYLKNSHEVTLTSDNQDPFYAKTEHSNLNLGLDFGFVERLNITKKIGIFASQHYGQALIGHSYGFKSTDLNFGLTYKLK